MVAAGFNVLLFTAPTNVKQSLNFDSYGAIANSQATTSLQSNFGAGLGYSYLPVMSLGFAGSLNWFEVAQRSTPTYHADGLRLDVNLAFAFNKYLNIKVGGNLTDFTNTEDSMFQGASGVGLGYQALLGVRILRNLGIDAGYMSMQAIFPNSSGTNPDGASYNESGSITLSGFYAGLIATF